MDGHAQRAVVIPCSYFLLLKILSDLPVSTKNIILGAGWAFFLRVLHAFWGAAEAGSSLVPTVSHSFVACDSLSILVESPSSRVQRVNAALHGHHSACDTHNSQNSYSVHGACGVLNSENSVGDRRWRTSLPCTWGNKGTECEYSVWG